MTRRVFVKLRKGPLSTSRSQRQGKEAAAGSHHHHLSAFVRWSILCCLSLRSVPLNAYIESQENAAMRVPSMLLMPFVALFGLVSARSATGDRVLVVLESAAIKDDYSQFWDSLQRTQIPYKCYDILTTN